MSLIYAFSKKIKEGGVVHQQIADAVDVSKIGEVIQKLEQLPKAQQMKLDDLLLRANVKEWATSLVTGYPENVREKEMSYILSDFTDSMKTRMREESKYAIGLLMPGKLILCHSSFGEETITPEWKTIPRMLDTDNVLRYVCFNAAIGSVAVRYWEREATNSFIEWLGLPNKAAFLFGGRYRFCCEIEGITTELQLTEQEMEQWLHVHSEIKSGKIEFSSPFQLLNINEIMVGRKRYEDPEDFLQDYEAEKQGILRYEKEYEKIKNEVLPLWLKYFDDKAQLVRKEEDEITTVVMKSTPGLDILFADGRIEFRASYLTDIAKRFINGEPMKIFHAGCKFKSPPLDLGSMGIYNRIHLDSLTEQLVEYYNSVSLQDKNLIALLRYAILRKLGEATSELPISYFFGRLSQGVLSSATLNGKWTNLEGKVLEYKSGDFLSGNNEEIIKKLVEDVENKLKESPLKIYFIGVEDNGTLHPVLASRLKSDRIDAIRNGLRNGLAIDTIYACPIIQVDTGILMITAFRS